jgi:hypothetical protein
MLITPTLSRAVESADARWLQSIANVPQAAAGITAGPVNTGSQPSKSRSVIDDAGPTAKRTPTLSRLCCW